MPTPINNMQPTLVINQVIATQGIFPSRDGGSGTLAGTLGQVHFFAGNYVGDNTGLADTNGALLAIAQNTALFSLLGTNYGGNGQTTFALPDLVGRNMVFSGTSAWGASYDLGGVFGANSFTLNTAQVPAAFGGSGQSFDNQQESLAVGWYINAYGVYPSDGGGPASNLIGMVGAFAGNFAPNSTIPCDGRLLLISEYETLFNVIGTTYGGDGETNFAVPDLRGRTIIGSGTGADGHTYQLGEVVGSPTGTIDTTNMPGGTGGGGQPEDNMGPGLVLTALVALSGYFTGTDENTPGLGEIMFFAGNFAPGGYALARGQILPINQNQALFSLLGTTYGGNGQTNFQIPNLAGRTFVGEGNGFNLGEVLGSTDFMLGYAELPSLTIDGDSAANSLGGGDSDDVIKGFGAGDTLEGRGGADRLYGDNGNDTLNGGNGNDTLVGGQGQDTLNGGGDVDTANYAGAAAGVTVNLSRTNPQNTGGAGTDALLSVENLQGSGFNDILTGDAQANTLNGGAGDDTLNGGAGNDTLNGGGGSDVASYFGAGAGVTVDLAISGPQATGSGTDTLIGIENLTGSQFDDVLSGNGSANIIAGGLGDDRLSGRDGNDILSGGTGADSLNGGAGDDILNGGAGANTLIGGTGNDRFRIDVLETAADRELIKDFVQGDDRIELSRSAFAAYGGSAAGLIDPASFAVSTVGATQPGHHVIYNPVSGALLYDADGAGGANAALIAILSGAPTLTAGDIFLI